MQKGMNMNMRVDGSTMGSNPRTLCLSERKGCLVTGLRHPTI